MYANFQRGLFTMKTRFNAVLIDDDHGPMDYFAEALRGAGFTVLHIDDIDMAVDFIKSVDIFNVDLFIVDIMMLPGGTFSMEETDNGMRTGSLLARMIRGRLPRVPIAMLTNQTASREDLDIPSDSSLFRKFDESPLGFAQKARQYIQVPA